MKMTLFVVWLNRTHQPMASVFNESAIFPMWDKHLKKKLTIYAKEGEKEREKEIEESMPSCQLQAVLLIDNSSIH